MVSFKGIKERFQDLDQALYFLTANWRSASGGLLQEGHHDDRTQRGRPRRHPQDPPHLWVSSISATFFRVVLLLMSHPHFFGSPPTLASSNLQVAYVRHLPGTARAWLKSAEQAVVVSEPLTHFYLVFQWKQLLLWATKLWRPFAHKIQQKVPQRGSTFD